MPGGREFFVLSGQLWTTLAIKNKECHCHNRGSCILESPLKPIARRSGLIIQYTFATGCEKFSCKYMTLSVSDNVKFHESIFATGDENEDQICGHDTLELWNLSTVQYRSKTSREDVLFPTSAYSIFRTISAHRFSYWDSTTYLWHNRAETKCQWFICVNQYGNTLFFHCLLSLYQQCKRSKHNIPISIYPWVDIAKAPWPENGQWRSRIFTSWSKPTLSFSG